MSVAAQGSPPTPSILRRLASMLYEAVVLAAVAFFAGSLFLLASQGQQASGLLRFALQLYLLAVFAAYFLWCWLRGGQTLPMKAWGIGWALVDRDRQFLHDRLAGTRLIQVD
jgi:uncharacterized RDD family membrane protein YckC